MIEMAGGLFAVRRQQKARQLPGLENIVLGSVRSRYAKALTRFVNRDIFREALFA